jgi:hypothetical protein
VVLLDDGAKIPFVARYRKEATGALVYHCAAPDSGDCAAGRHRKAIIRTYQMPSSRSMGMS